VSVVSATRSPLAAAASSSFATKAADIFAPCDEFKHRHMGSQGKDKQAMLDKLGFASLDELVGSTVPKQIRLGKKLTMDPAMSESEALSKLKGIMSKNKVS
jgi:glycine cleavage system pyridoxal-binding protein P